ncbi:MAG: DegT/DnrJ/EryC1/StrS family aminotransferase [Acidobacteria bacterium]|jgi:hypothetical protein|nr:DegT/DnrJ/EryC1/StrS family aminotransferase [Acidobacteriota bacterium]
MNIPLSNPDMTKKEQDAVLAEVLGSSLNGRKCDSFGNAGLFVFYPNKQVNTGEGGVLLTNYPELDYYLNKKGYKTTIFYPGNVYRRDIDLISPGLAYSEQNCYGVNYVFCKNSCEEK